MINPKAVNKYLKDNGIAVGHNTDKYYRLSDNKIKAWYVGGVPEPSNRDLIPYEDEVFNEELANKLIQDTKRVLAGTDPDLARMLEDALAILKDKHGIDLEADFSPEAKTKLDERRAARAALK